MYSLFQSKLTSFLTPTKSFFSAIVFLLLLATSFFIAPHLTRAGVINITGTVYYNYDSNNDFPENPFDGVEVTLLVNGHLVDDIDPEYTDSDGTFIFSNITISNGDIVTVFLSNEFSSSRAVHFKKATGSLVDDLTLDLVMDYVTFSSENNARFDYESDLADVYSLYSPIKDLIEFNLLYGGDENEVLIKKNLNIGANIDFVQNQYSGMNFVFADGLQPQVIRQINTDGMGNPLPLDFSVRMNTRNTMGIIFGTGLNLPGARLYWNSIVGGAEISSQTNDPVAFQDLIIGPNKSFTQYSDLIVSFLGLESGATFYHNNKATIFTPFSVYGGNLGIATDTDTVVTFDKLYIRDTSGNMDQVNFDFPYNATVEVLSEFEVNLGYRQLFLGSNYYGYASTLRFGPDLVINDPFGPGSGLDVPLIADLRVDSIKLEIDEANETLSTPLFKFGDTYYAIGDALNAELREGWFEARLVPTPKQRGAEPNTPVIFEVETLIRNAFNPIEIEYQLHDGSALGDTDFETDAVATLGAWQGRGEISIPVIDNTLIDGTRYFDISLISIQGFDVDPSVKVRGYIDDNDTATVVISETELETSEGDAPVTYTLTTNVEPSGVIVVDVSTSNGFSTISPTQITLDENNWEDGVTVTVTTVDNNIVDGTRTNTIAHEVNEAATTDDDFAALGNLASIVHTINDNDTAAFTVTPTSLTIDEDGGSDTFTVVLDKQPLNDVSFAINSSDNDEAIVSPTSLTFTGGSSDGQGNWDTAQTITVTGVNDSDIGTDTASITVSVDGSSAEGWLSLANQIVSVTLTDDDDMPVPTPTPTPVPTPTPTMSPTPTPTPTVTPTPTPSSSPTPTESPAPTQKPSDSSSSKNNDAAKSDSGESVCSKEKPGSTPDIFQINYTDTVAYLYLVPPKKPLTHYIVSYGYEAGAEDFAARFDAIDDTSGVHMIEVKDLDPNLVYHFRIQGWNDCEPGDWSNELEIQTNTNGDSKENIRYKNTVFLIRSRLGRLPVATPLPQNHGFNAASSASSAAASQNSADNALTEASIEDKTQATNDVDKKSDTNDADGSDTSRDATVLTNETAETEQPSLLRRLLDAFTGLFR